MGKILVNQVYYLNLTVRWIAKDSLQIYFVTLNKSIVTSFRMLILKAVW